MTDLDFYSQLEKTIENIPDFPKKGIQFKDITPVFSNTELYHEVIKRMAEFSKGKIDVVCGIESRGFLFGISIATYLGVPFVLIRKKGKLPPPTVSESYDLEYGSAEIEIREGQIKKGQCVLIHDDLLATGGTTQAAGKMIQKIGADVAQFSFLITLDDLKGEEKLKQFNAEVYSVLHY